MCVSKRHLAIDGSFWAGRTVLVTGASGFKGSWLTEILTHTGAHVVGTARPRSHRLAFWTARELSERIDTAHIDICNLEEVTELINTIAPDIIFHLAAKALVPFAKREPLKTFKTNFMGTINIIEACRKLRLVEKLVICSTDHVFGNPPGITEDMKFDEKSPLHYSGPYDTSKAAMEMATASYVDLCREDLPAIAVTRCANVFGPGDVNQRRIIPEFIQASQTQKQFGPRYPANRRQYIYVLDAVLGYIKTAEMIQRDQSGEAFHFAIESYDIGENTKVSISALELARSIGKIASSRGRHILIDESVKQDDFAPNENRFQALDCTWTKRYLGWNTLYTFEEGLEATYDWYEAISRDDSHVTDIMDNIVRTQLGLSPHSF